MTILHPRIVEVHGGSKVTDLLVYFLNGFNLFLIHEISWILHWDLPCRIITNLCYKQKKKLRCLNEYMLPLMLNYINNLWVSIDYFNNFVIWNSFSWKSRPWNCEKQHRLIMGTSPKKWQIQNRVIDLIIVNVGTKDTFRAKCLLSSINYNILHIFMF